MSRGTAVQPRDRSIGARMARWGDCLTRDRASRLDPYIRWVRRPWAILAVAACTAILCGICIHPRVLILASGLVGVLAIGTAWPWAALRGISGELTFDRSRIREGEATAARLLIRNRLPWSAWALTVRGVGTAEAGTTPGAYAAGWSETETSWNWSPDRRGEYPGASARLVSSFPFGLWEASRPLAAPRQLLVWPRTFPVGPLPEAAGGREGEGAAARNRPGTSGDLLGVRPYRRGDSLRRVHWPQSARRDALIVCELECRATPVVQVVLDLDADAHAGIGPNSSREWMIRVAASFAEDWIGQGADVGLVFGAKAVAAGPGSTASRKSRVLDALARIGEEGSPPLGDLLRSPACRTFEGGLRIVVATDRSAPGAPGPERPRSGPAERFVVLGSEAFADEGAAPRLATGSSGWFRPWILLDDPDSVAAGLRSGWKELHSHALS